MKNKISDGKTTNVVVSAAVTAGTFVAIGDHFGGVAINDAAKDEVCVLATEGVFELPKAAGVIAAGTMVSMQAGNVTPTDVAAASGTLEGIAKHIGYAEETVVSASTTIKVRLK